MENGFELCLQCTALYGYSFLRAGVSPVQSLSLWVGEEAPLGQAELELSFEPAVFSPWKRKLGPLRRGERIFVPELCDGLAEGLLGNHGGSLEITCLLKGEEGVLSQTRARVPLCDVGEFYPWDSYLSLNASLVTPEALAVSRLAEQLPRKRSGGGGRFAKAEIASWLEAAYELLRRQEITYSIHGFSGEKKGQRLRFPSQCLREKTANVAELAFLFASVVEASGLDAVLIFSSSAVTVGVYSGEHPTVCSEIFDAEPLREQLRRGILTVLDPSCFCYGTNFPFSICEKNARTALEQGEEFLGALDVAKARAEGVLSVPSELYEKVSEEYAQRLIPLEQAKEEESLAQKAQRELLRSRRIADLLELKGEELSLTASQALVSSEVESEAFASEDRACLGVGRVEYHEPLRGEGLVSCLLLYPMVKNGEKLWKKSDAPILNTPLLERLSVLYGLYTAEAEEAFALRGEEALLRELADFFAEKQGVSLQADLCMFGIFDPYPCLSYDALRRFSPKPLSGEPLWEEGSGALWDKDAVAAAEGVKNQRLSLIHSPDSSLREDLVLELSACAMAAGRSVKLISPRAEHVRQRLECLAAKASEQEEAAVEKTSYFDELFFVHPHGYSFYHAHLLWDRYSHAPEAVRIPSALLEGMEPQDVVEWSKAVSELTEAWEQAGGVKENPLRRVENPFYSEEYKEEAYRSAAKAEEALEAYTKRLEELWELFSLTGEISFGAAKGMNELLARLAEAKEVPYYYYERRSDRLSALVETGKKYAALRQRLTERFLPSLFRLDAEGLHREPAGEKGFLRKRVGKKEALKALRACARPGIVVNEANVDEILEQLLRQKEYEQYLGEQTEQLKLCFGVDVQSPDGEPTEVWTRLSELCRKGEAVWEAYRRMEGAEETKLSKLCKSEEMDSRWAEEAQKLSAAEREWKNAEEVLVRLLNLKPDTETTPAQSLAALKAMMEAMDSLRDWTLWLHARSSAATLGLAGVVEQCESGCFDAQELKLNFLCGFFRGVAEHIRSHSPALERFDADREREGMEALRQRGEQRLCRLCREAVSKGKLFCLSLREAAKALREEPVSLLIVDGAQKLGAKEALGLLAMGEQSVILASPLKECEGGSLASAALALGAKEFVLSHSYAEEPLFWKMAGELASHGGHKIAASAYPVLSPSCKTELVRVNGGYDEATGTNVIEASVIVDELLGIISRGEDSATVVCLGEAQRKLVTLLLAKRLAEQPQTAARYLADPSRYVVCALGEEAPKADCVLVSLCFSCPHGKYGEGLSGKLATALGENPLTSLTKLYFLPRKRLCFTAAFTVEEVEHTHCITEQMRVFALFVRPLFSLSRLQWDVRETSPLCDGVVDKIAAALEQKGYACRKNAGFSSVGTPLLVEDPRAEKCVALAVIADETLRALCHDSACAAGYLDGFGLRGVKVFRLSALAWYCDRERVLGDLIALLEESVGESDALMAEMTPLKTE